MSFSPPNYTLSIISYNPLAGKSSLCKRLIDSNVDNYKTFLLTNTHANSSWFYWGSIKHRRLDEKREGIFHLIEHSSIHIDEKEFIDNYIKRLSNLTFRIEDKNLPKDKLHVDAFLCIYDLSLRKSLSDFLILLHGLLKTRRPLIIITTKNDLVDNQLNRAQVFEQSIHHSFSTIPILHTSAHEHVNIQSVLELALYACDELTKKHFYKKYYPPNYVDAYKNEQSLKHVIQTEYRALLNRHVPDYRIVSWEKFYDRWQHHTSVQTFIDMFGKYQAKCVFDEHIEELKRLSREKLIDERLIPIIELLIPDHKTKLSRNWDYVRLQMQKHPRYSSTVISSSKWSDAERNNTNSTNSLVIPDDLLETCEARLRFEAYLQTRQIEQVRRTNCRAFFDLLNRFSQAGLIHYGDSFDKDCVYFLGRESYESLNSHDRLRVFALHQSYLYRLICLNFIELLFESFEIFVKTFEQMNLATQNHFSSEQLSNGTIDDIFEKEILEQIKHDQRYQALNKRDTDRHRLIMCHCHFLYDSIYYPSMNIPQLVKQRRQSFRKRQPSINSIEENFCPYMMRKCSTTAIQQQQQINDENPKKKLDIICPMESHCADMRIVQEIVLRLKGKHRNKNVLICGLDEQANYCLKRLLNELIDFEMHFFTLKTWKNQTIDGCLLLNENAQELLSQKRFQVNLELLPTVSLNEQTLVDMTTDQLRSTVEKLFSNDEILTNKSSKPNQLRILIVFMCGSERNDVEVFFSQLSTRFSLTVANQSTFIINAFLSRANRKIELVPVSFHSLFSVQLTDFNGVILFSEHERQAAQNTMLYLDKHIRKKFSENLDKKPPLIYRLSCVKDPTQSNIGKYSNAMSIDDHSIGTIRNFLESHFVPFLNQCYVEKFGPSIENVHYQNDDLLASVTSYFDHNRAIHSSTTDLMTSSLDRTHSNLSSKSSDHSPKHHHSLLTPTNQEQIFTYRSYPYLSNSTNGADSTIVPTTPVEPSIPNLSLVSSTNSVLDPHSPYFQKSTSMRFAKLIEHPINHLTFTADKNIYPSSSLSNGNVISRRKISNDDEMKFRLYKHRTAPQVKVPLATPEIVELSEILTQSLSIHDYYESSPKIRNNPEENSPKQQTRVTDSSVDSSSDERTQTSTIIVQNTVSLQRKPSDRKNKRTRAKQNDITGSTSSSEVLKKPGSDDDDKRTQKKKRRPSLKRRKKSVHEQGQTDSGIDSRMDSSKVNNTPEPSTSVVISNEDDSSVGDGLRDSKNASVEELEERSTANWIRRQLQIFAQNRREKTELKTRSSALTTITSISSPPLFKGTLTLTSSSPLSSHENTHHQVPIRLNLSRCILSTEFSIPMFVVQCIHFIEEHGLTIEGLYRISGHKNQVEFVINKLVENPHADLNALQVPVSAVATAFKDMMRKLDEPILSLEQFDDCQTLTIEQLREENFSPLQEALLRTNDLKYRTNRFIFKHLHFVSQHSALTHMDSSNLAVLWWPNLFQPQFHDLRTAEQICQKAKPLIQTIIDNYSIIFNCEHIKDK